MDALSVQIPKPLRTTQSTRHNSSNTATLQPIGVPRVTRPPTICGTERTHLPAPHHQEVTRWRHSSPGPGHRPWCMPCGTRVSLPPLLTHLVRQSAPRRCLLYAGYSGRSARSSAKQYTLLPSPVRCHRWWRPALKHPPQLLRRGTTAIYFV